MPSPRKQKPAQPVVPGEIYYLDQPRFRGADDPHYCVVLQIDGDSAFVNFLSSQMDCFDESEGDILVRKSDLEFTANGLKKDTFLVNRSYARDVVPLSNLIAIRGKVGRVEGEFKKRIENLWGDSLA